MSSKGRRREGTRRADLLLRHEVSILFQKGRAALRRGHHHEAEEVFARIIGIEPFHRGALAGLGEVHLHRKEHAQACELLERAIAAGGASEHLIYNVANACRGAQRRDRAFKYFEQLVTLNPSHLKGLTRFGEACLERKDFPRAEEVFRQALELDSGNLYALRGLAGALRGRRAHTEAIAVWERLLTLAPDDHRVILRLGEAYEHEGDAASAVRAFRLALEVQPGNTYALAGLARLEGG